MPKNRPNAGVWLVRNRNGTVTFVEHRLMRFCNIRRSRKEPSPPQWEPQFAPKRAPAKAAVMRHSEISQAQKVRLYLYFPEEWITSSMSFEASR
jgi:hypothetical protein